MRITILNLADKFVLKFKRLFYAQISEVLSNCRSMPICLCLVAVTRLINK